MSRASITVDATGNVIRYGVATDVNAKSRWPFPIGGVNVGVMAKDCLRGVLCVYFGVL